MGVQLVYWVKSTCRIRASDGNLVPGSRAGRCVIVRSAGPGTRFPGGLRRRTCPPAAVKIQGLRRAGASGSDPLREPGVHRRTNRIQFRPEAVQLLANFRKITRLTLAFDVLA